MSDVAITLPSVVRLASIRDTIEYLIGCPVDSRCGSARASTLNPTWTMSERLSGRSALGGRALGASWIALVWWYGDWRAFAATQRLLLKMVSTPAFQ